MGFWDFLRPKKKATNEQKTQQHYVYAPTMSGYSPIFASFGDNIYASDIIVRAVSCVSNEMMKLRPRHKRFTEERKRTIFDSSIAKCLRHPNEFMTTADFLSKISVLHEITDNAYIYPDYYVTKSGEKYYTGLYPLKPMNVEYIMNESNGKVYIRFTFGNGSQVTIPNNEVIHWRNNYGVDDYFGGNTALGGNKELIKNLNTFAQIKQSIAEALKCSLSINGVMQYISLISEDKLKQEREKFVQDLRDGKSSVLFLDNQAEYVSIPRDIKLVDKDTLEFFYETILMTTGVSMPILKGDYNHDQWSAFYESKIKPGIISLEQSISKVVFNDRMDSFGNEIILRPDEIRNMSMDKKIEWLKVAVPAGAVSKNEIRDTVGLPPFDGGDEYPRGYNSVDKGAVGSEGNSTNNTNNINNPNSKEVGDGE